MDHNPRATSDRTQRLPSRKNPPKAPSAPLPIRAISPISQDLIEEIRNLNTEKGWREDVTGAREGYEFPAYVALGHSEFTEALEAYRDRIWSSTTSEVVEGTNKIINKPIGVGPELADVIIRALDMCDIWGIDINHEIRRVLDFGWKRSYQHGGRIL